MALHHFKGNLAAAAGLWGVSSEAFERYRDFGESGATADELLAYAAKHEMNISRESAEAFAASVAANFAAHRGSGSRKAWIAFGKLCESGAGVDELLDYAKREGLNYTRPQVAIMVRNVGKYQG